MKIENAADLDNAILDLERRKTLQEGLLTDQFHTTVDHFRPKNLIKSAFNNVLKPGSTQSKIIKTAGGIGVGILTKKLLLGKSTSLLGKLAGNALKMGATNTVIHNSDKIKAWGSAIYKNLFSKSKSGDQITF